MNVFRARLDTRNFSFETFHTHHDGAVELMRRLWELHRKQCGADVALMYSWSEIAEDVEVDTLKVPGAYRDDQWMNV